MSEFADYRINTIYLSEPVFEPEKLGLRSVERGENVWIVVPKDEGVFQVTQEISGVSCVHPVQVYLDLLAHPERADEAAKELRASLLTWRADA